MKIGPLKKVTAEALSDVNRLMVQLRGKEVGAGTRTELRAIVEGKNNVMLVAQEGKKIIGIATLYVLQKVGKRIGHVEDVVVDSDYRGQGIGKNLMKEVIAVAKTRKLDALNLTSRPERVAANALYKKIGFKIKKTNPYSLYL